MTIQELLGIQYHIAVEMQESLGSLMLHFGDNTGVASYSISHCCGNARDSMYSNVTFLLQYRSR